MVKRLELMVLSCACSHLLHKLDETAKEQPHALHAVLNDPNSPSDSG